MTLRGLLASGVVLLAWLSSCLAIRTKKYRHDSENSLEHRKATCKIVRLTSTERLLIAASDIIAAIVGSIAFVCCCYICSRICPDGPVFSALEMDQIRVDRVSEVESTLENQIEALQVCLNRS
jgi:hypothetical protein